MQAVAEDEGAGMKISISHIQRVKDAHSAGGEEAEETPKGMERLAEDA